MRETPLMIGLVLFAFIFVKMTPHIVIVALHNPVIIFVSLLILLWLTTASPKLGVLGLLWLGGLYLERNRRTLYTANSQSALMGNDPTMPVSPSQHVPSYMKPVRVDYAFEPSSGCEAGNEWSPVDDTIDHKRPPLTTVPPGAATGDVLLGSGKWWRSTFGSFASPASYF